MSRSLKSPSLAHSFFNIFLSLHHQTVFWDRGSSQHSTRTSTDPWSIPHPFHLSKWFKNSFIDSRFFRVFRVCSRGFSWTFLRTTWNHEKNPYYFPLYWLVNKDPYHVFKKILNNWVVCHPLYNPQPTRVFFMAQTWCATRHMRCAFLNGKEHWTQGCSKGSCDARRGTSSHQVTHFLEDDGKWNSTRKQWAVDPSLCMVYLKHIYLGHLRGAKGMVYFKHTCTFKGVPNGS